MKEWLKAHKTYSCIHDEDEISDELSEKLERFKIKFKDLNPRGLLFNIDTIYKINDYEYCIYILHPIFWNYEDSYWSSRNEEVRYVLTINDQVVGNKTYSNVADLEIMIILQELNRNYNVVYGDEKLFHLSPFISMQHLIEDISAHNEENAKPKNPEVTISNLEVGKPDEDFPLPWTIPEVREPDKDLPWDTSKVRKSDKDLSWD